MPVFVHWSVLLLAGFFLLSSADRIFHALAGIGAYFLILVVHELGHQFVAARLGYRVLAVEIYPIHGLCRFDHPETKMEAAKIAWGGVIGQLLLAAPALIRLVYWGYSNFGPLNAALAICGPSNVAIALFNLIPVRPLDGATSWPLLPLLWAAHQRKKTKSERSALEVFNEMVEKQKRR